MKIIRVNLIKIKDQTDDQKWIICDGPVDAIWVENLNMVLDDNKCMCLATGERIKLTKYMRMIFEVQDVKCASPATVSRCGMVYVHPNELGYMPYVRTWIKNFNQKFGELNTQYLLDLFTKYIDDGFNFVNINCTQTIKQVDIGKVSTLCSLFDSLITANKDVDSKLDEVKLKSIICTTFVFCYVWAIGGNLKVECWNSFDSFVRTQFKENSDANLKLTSDFNLFSYYIDVKNCHMDLWEKIVPEFVYKSHTPYFELIVPTIDTYRYGYLMEKLLSTKKSVLFTGETGVGKSVIARDTLYALSQKGDYSPVFLDFSHQTSSNRVQEFIEANLEKKHKNVLGAPINKHKVLFIDDINMPKLQCYGAQPAVELLRQYQNNGGFYSRSEGMPFIEIKDMTICAACSPPGGGRNMMAMNMIRHFSMFSIPTPNDNNLNYIFKSIIGDFFKAFNSSVKECTNKIVEAAVDIYSNIKSNLLPTPAKPHYVFNLRDLSKYIQGILKVKPDSINDKEDVCKLFCHETQRVFHDGLINFEDKEYFNNLLSEMAYKYFGQVSFD